MNYFRKHFHNQVLKYFWKYLSSRDKVFGIGLNKTSTSSLGHYFEELGYYHSFETYTPEKCKKFLTDKDYLFGEVDKFDMHEDWPWAFVYKDLFFRYPQAKFILTLRDSPEQWFTSLRKTTINFGPNGNNKIFYGNEFITEEMKIDLINQYNKHTEDVISFFSGQNASGRLYVLTVSDKEKELNIAKLLKISYNPNVKYPHLHKSPK